MNKLRKLIGNSISKVVKSRNGLLYYLKYQKDLEILNKIRKIGKDNNIPNFWEIEAYMYAQCLISTQHLEGDVAEVGVYIGRTAKMIEGFRGDRCLFLFDTFTGIPGNVKEIDDMYWEGKYDDVNYEKVKEMFKGDPNVFIHKGVFPQDTGYTIKLNKFSFVHLDVNIYQSTKDCLEFFWPKMVDNGIILIHNTSQAEGAKQALQEFNKKTNTIAVKLPCNLSLMIK